MIFSILGHLADCVHQTIIGNFHWWYLIKFPIRATLLEGSVYGNLPLWFLPSLLAVQLLYAFLHRKIRDEWICLLGFIVAYATYLCEWNEPLYVGNISLGLLAYSMGHLLRDRQYKHTILLLAFVSYIVTFVIQPAFIDFRMNYLDGGYYPIAVMFGLSGCILVNNLFKRLSLRIRLLEYIGIRSMRYYVMHWMVLSVCSWTLNLSGWYLLAIMMGSCIVLLPLAEKAFILFRLDWVFGLKKPIKKLICNS